MVKGEENRPMSRKKRRKGVWWGVGYRGSKIVQLKLHSWKVLYGRTTYKEHTQENMRAGFGGMKESEE